MTLADKDTNSKLIDNANRAFHGNVAMRVMQPSDNAKFLLANGRWRHLVVVTSRTDPSVVVLEITQAMESIYGSVVSLTMFILKLMQTLFVSVCFFPSLSSCCFLERVVLKF